MFMAADKIQTVFKGAISVFLGKVARGAPIQIWGDGNVVRDYIYIDDLVDAVCKAVKSKTA